MKRIASLVAILTLVGIDQATKFIGKNNSGQLFIHQGVLWSNQAGQLAMVKISVGLCLLVVLAYALLTKKENIWLIKDKGNQALTGLTFMMAGGISNMLDWVFYHGIVNVATLGPLSFNGADIYILIGALLFLLSPSRHNSFLH